MASKILLERVRKRGIFMKKWKQRAYAWTLFLAMIITAISPGFTAKAEEPATESHGLMGEWYRAAEGEGINGFVFKDEKYLGNTLVDSFQDINFKSMISEMLGHNNDMQYVLAKFTGKIEIPENADYTFYMIGDDGFRLYIDNELVIDFWEQAWEQEKISEPISLTAGTHDIRIDYLQGHGGAWLSLKWSSVIPDTSPVSAPIEKSHVPPSAFYQTKEHSFNAAKRALTTELAKAQSALVSVAGSETEKAFLKEAYEKVAAFSEKTYAEETAEADIQAMNQAAESLAGAKTAYIVSTGVQEKSQHTSFFNPLYQGQDPFVTQKDGFYYLVSSSNDDSECKIYVSKSRTLTDQGEKKLVMDVAGKQRRVFAPELFFFDDAEGGHLYIYYCADVLDYERDYPKMAAKYQLNSDQHHIACCLRSKTQDPMGEWEDIGPLYCGEEGIIYGANDITAVEYDGSIFLIWGTLGTGQPQGPAIVEMDTPSTVTKDRDMLPIGGGEGPRALKNENGELFVTMSEGGYSTNGYRLSILCYTGDSKAELLNESKWYAKRDVFTSTTNVSGPARASFVKSADGTEDWMVYHSRVYKEVDDNWWRQVNIKKFEWDKDGMPVFGAPASTNKTYALPSGDPGQGDMYEAEYAVLEGGVKTEDSNSNYYGDGYVYVPNTAGAAVNFIVNAQEAGDYIVGLRYAYGVQKSGETTNRPNVMLPTRAVMNISVNGEVTDSIQMDKTSFTWNEWFTGSKRMTLRAGANLITYSVDKGCIGDVRLDALTMYKADVPYTEIVKEVKPESISLTNTYAILEEGGQTQINATVAPTEAVNKKLHYSSDNDAVAKVDANGLVSAVSQGHAIIQLTADGNPSLTEEFYVYVTKKTEQTKPEPEKTVIKPVYVEFAKKEIQLTAGAKSKISAKIYPANAENKAVTFVSSNKAVATVDASGNITAKAPGSAVITATAAGNTAVKQTCTVTVNPKKVSWGKVTRKKSGAITLKWKKQSGITGYKIYRSEKKKGTYQLIKTVKGASKVSYTDKKASRKKTYYYKICSYKKVGAKTYTGALSAVKTVKKK